MKGGKFRFFGTACFWNRLAAGGNDAEPLPPLLAGSAEHCLNEFIPA